MWGEKRNRTHFILSFLVDFSEDRSCKFSSEDRKEVFMLFFPQWQTDYILSPNLLVSITSPRSPLYFPIYSLFIIYTIITYFPNNLKLSDHFSVYHIPPYQKHTFFFFSRSSLPPNSHPSYFTPTVFFFLLFFKLGQIYNCFFNIL